MSFLDRSQTFYIFSRTQAKGTEKFVNFLLVLKQFVTRFYEHLQLCHAMRAPGTCNDKDTPLM